MTFAPLLLALCPWLAPGPGDSDAAVLVRELSTRRLSVEWEDHTLENVVRDLTLMLDLPFWIAPALEERREETVTLRQRNVRALSLLGILKRLLDVRFLLSDGLIVVTSEEDLIARSAVLRLYDVRSALWSPPSFRPPRPMGLRPSGTFEEEPEDPEPATAMDPDTLVDLIRRGTGEDQWRSEHVSIQILGGRLVVRHTPSMQRKVERMLLMLRAF